MVPYLVSFNPRFPSHTNALTYVRPETPAPMMATVFPSHAFADAEAAEAGVPLGAKREEYVVDASSEAILLLVLTLGLAVTLDPRFVLKDVTAPIDPAAAGDDDPRCAARDAAGCLVSIPSVVHDAPPPASASSLSR